MEGYNNAITNLKAIGIILMVIGHCAYEIPYCRQFIYMFHMPLFFFAAGFCFKRSYLDNPLLFLFKRIKGLYIPFVKWSLIFLFLHNSFFYINLYSEAYDSEWWCQHPYSFTELTSHFFSIVFSMRGQEMILGGYWFLHALFWGSIIGWIVMKLFRLYPELSLLAVLIFFFPMNHYQWRVPFFEVSPQSFLSAFFFVIGHLFAFRKISFFHFWSFPCIIIFTIVGSFFWRSDMDNAFYNGYKVLPFLINAVLMVWGLFSLLNRVVFFHPLQVVLSFIGRHTLSILTFHLLAFKFVSLIIIFYYHLPAENLAQFPIIYNHTGLVWCFAYTLFGIVFSLLTVSIGNCLRQWRSGQVYF